MVTITIPRLLARIAQLALDLDAADDPEMALAATEAAIAHFVTRMPSSLYQPLCDAAKAAYGLPHGDRTARQILREVAVLGDASEFEAGGGHPLAGVRFAFEAAPTRDTVVLAYNEAIDIRLPCGSIVSVALTYLEPGEQYPELDVMLPRTLAVNLFGAGLVPAPQTAGADAHVRTARQIIVPIEEEAGPCST